MCGLFGSGYEKVGCSTERKESRGVSLEGALCGGGCIRVVLALGHSELHLQTLEPTSSTS